MNKPGGAPCGLLLKINIIKNQLKPIKTMKKYTLYLGLNDKDTKTQQIATLEAYKIISNIIAKDFDGGTIYEARGVYRHDDGTATIENTLRIELLFTTRPAVLALIEELKKLFNQESVALQEETINSELV